MDVLWNVLKYANKTLKFLSIKVLYLVDRICIALQLQCMVHLHHTLGVQKGREKCLCESNQFMYVFLTMFFVGGHWPINTYHAIKYFWT